MTVAGAALRTACLSFLLREHAAMVAGRLPSLASDFAALPPALQAEVEGSWAGMRHAYLGDRVKIKEEDDSNATEDEDEVCAGLCRLR
jgi:hypothetical protein